MLTDDVLSQNCKRSILPTRCTIDSTKKRSKESWKQRSLHASNHVEEGYGREFQQLNYSTNLPKAWNHSAAILEDNVDIHVEPIDWTANSNDDAISSSTDIHES